MPIRPQSRGWSAAALLTLLLQLLVVGLAPAADARASAADTGTAAGVHMEQPGVHHPVHDAQDCALCIVLQAGARPASALRAPEARRLLRVARLADAHRHPLPALPAFPDARAPPAA